MRLVESIIYPAATAVNDWASSTHYTRLQGQLIAVCSSPQAARNWKYVRHVYIHHITARPVLFHAILILPPVISCK